MFFNTLMCIINIAEIFIIHIIFYEQQHTNINKIKNIKDNNNAKS